MMDLDRDTREALVALLGDRVAFGGMLSKGANSRVFAIDVGGRRYAVKRYPDWRISGSDRSTKEWEALQFLWSAGLSAVPRPIAVDRKQGILVVEWLDGSPVLEPSGEDTAQASRFLRDVFRLSSTKEALNFGLASEACLSGSEILRQIEQRLTSFIPYPDLESFLSRRLMPALMSISANARRTSGFDVELDRPLRCLVPADFGFHNALKEADGRIRFFDFDYFGWDDPVKLVADVVLHPAMNLPSALKKQFIAAMIATRADDGGFADRLRRYLPLYALRWALIVLNVFRRDRQSAEGIDKKSWAAKLDGQLKKAMRLVLAAEEMEANILFKP